MIHGASRGRERLEGQFVLCAPLLESDLDRRLEMVNDREVQKLYIGDQSLTPTPSLIWRAGIMPSKRNAFSEQWAIETKDGKYIGDIDLHSINVIKGEGWDQPLGSSTGVYRHPTARTVGRRSS